MENTIIDSEISNSEMDLSARSLTFLKEIAKWGKFLSIVGFIGLGIMLIASLYLIYSGLSMGGFAMQSFLIPGITYLVMCILYYFPTLYLYKFSIKMNEAIQSGNESAIESAFENLKGVFKFAGILTIVVLCIYVLALLFALGTGLG